MTIIRNLAELDARLRELDARKPTGDQPAILIMEESLSVLAIAELARRKERDLARLAMNDMLRDALRGL